MKHTGCTAEPTPTEDCMELREQVKSVEFAAEKMQQQVLESLVSIEELRTAAADQHIDDVAANFKRYLEGLDIQPAIEARKKLSVIVCAALPDFDKKIIAKAIETAS